MAWALHHLQQSVCGVGNVGLCPAMLPINGSLLRVGLFDTFDWILLFTLFLILRHPMIIWSSFTIAVMDRSICTRACSLLSLALILLWEIKLISICTIKDHLMNVSFPFGNETVQFDSNGNPPGWYDIMNYQHLPSGGYNYVKIGNWKNGTLSIPENPIKLPTSVCSEPCSTGQAKVSACCLNICIVFASRNASGRRFTFAGRLAGQTGQLSWTLFKDSAVRMNADLTRKMYCYLTGRI